MWGTLVGINSVLCAIACAYVVYAAGASIYYLTWKPLEIGVLAVFVLIVTQVVFAALEG